MAAPAGGGSGGSGVHPPLGIVVVDGGAVDVVTTIEVLGTLLVGVVVADTDVVEVVGVSTGVEPHKGGVGSTLDRHVFVLALRVAPQAARHFRPALRSGHAALQVCSSVRSSVRQSRGHLAANAEGPSRSSAATIATIERTWAPAEIASSDL